MEWRGMDPEIMVEEGKLILSTKVYVLEYNVNEKTVINTIINSNILQDSKKY